MGYSGATTQNPTYRDLKGHSEAFEVWYDPAQLSYKQLLAYVWDSHNPHYNTSSVQYQNVIWVENAEQRAIAEKQKAAIEERDGEAVDTLIMEHTKFWPAEDYHQKYALRQNRALMPLFERWYPDGRDFRESFTAMRLNAYMQGYGSSELLLSELDGYGLPDELSESLKAESSKLSTEKEMSCPIPGG